MGKEAIRRAAGAVGLGMLALAAGGCTLTDKITGGVAGGTLVLAQAPSQELVQTYYVGIFDPQDQVPQAVYRIRLRGQSSFLSQAKIQAGWVPAPVADSLTTSFSLFASQAAKPGEGGGGALAVDPSTRIDPVTLSGPDRNRLNRRLLVFGPEGFREAPSDNRFVVVAGSSPEAFFQAVSETLGEVASARDGAGTRVLRADLLQALTDLSADRRVLETLKRGIDVDLAVKP